MEVLKIKVFVQDKFVKSQDFSPDMLLAYIGLRMIIVKDKNEYYISTGLLSYSIFGKQIVNQLMTKLIIDGIKQLINKKIVIHIDSEKKNRSNEYILDLSQLQIDNVKSKKEEDFYSSIELDYIIKILDSKLKEKLELFRFYCYLMTTINKTDMYKVGTGFTSYVNMANVTGICRQTISKYMDILANDLKIIHIYKSTDAVIRNGVVTEIPNTYGDISNVEKINHVGSNYESNYGENSKRIKTTKKSSTRSASAKYNIFVSDLNTTGEVRYSDDELQVIYETLVVYNNRYSYNDNLQKDLSVFSGYNFYDGG